MFREIPLSRYYLIKVEVLEGMDKRSACKQMIDLTAKSK